MTNDDELLTKLGLHHADMHTHFTEIQFQKPKKLADLLKQVYEKFEELKKDHPDAKGKIKIDHVAITFGHADAMIVWEASDPQLAKMFRDYVLAIPDQRTETMVCYAHDGVH
jgi:hypothetical protein